MNNKDNSCKTGDNEDDRLREQLDDLLDSIKESGSAVPQNSRESIHILSIIGQVEGHYILPDTQKATKYEHIIPLLASIEEDDKTDGLLILLNTMGGDVEAGLAIAEVIASMSKPTVSVVLGGGHSIGVPLAVAADHSFIVKSATMTLHPVRINGLVIGVSQTFDYFRDMQRRIVTFICDHSRITPEQVNKLMMNPDMMATDVGTILEGPEAVELGLIDELGGIDTAISYLRGMIGRNNTTPESDKEKSGDKESEQGLANKKS